MDWDNSSMSMRFLVDADSFAREAKALLQKTAGRLAVTMVLVANRDLGYPSFRPMAGPGVWQLVAAQQTDGADSLIAQLAGADDLVFTRDIVFAQQLIQQNITVLNDRGTIFTGETIGRRLSLRHFMAELRLTGLAQDGPRRYNKTDVQKFAQALDRAIQSKQTANPTK